VLTVTRDMILPTTVTGSYPRPLWFDRSLAGRSFKAVKTGDFQLAEPTEAELARRRNLT
jgi:methionine synthase II (cobalamin-independent)